MSCRLRLILRSLFVAALVAVFWLAVQPAPEMAKLFSWQDKVEHAVLFAVLMGVGALAWPHHLLAVAATLLVYGVAMEIAQSFTTYRFGDVWDWIADALGVAAAAFALQRRQLGKSPATATSARDPA